MDELLKLLNNGDTVNHVQIRKEIKDALTKFIESRKQHEEQGYGVRKLEQVFESLAEKFEGYAVNELRGALFSGLMVE